MESDPKSLALPGISEYIGRRRGAVLRVTHLEDEHLISLNSQEASALVDACAMVLIAAESVPAVALPAHVTAVLAGVFQELSETAKQTQPQQSA